MDTPKVFESEYRFCLILWEHEPIKSSELVQAIISGNLHRGVTLLEAQGAFTGMHRQVAMCVIKHHQIGAFKMLVRSVDDKAFVIVSDVKNVFGKGFESISEVK